MKRRSTRFCSVPGTRAFVKKQGRWQKTPPLKALCGKLIRVTRLKSGDIRLGTDVGIIKVRGVEYAIPVHDIRKR